MMFRFLLAQLHLGSLTGKRSPKAIKTALRKLPAGSEAYDYAYKEAMERIEGQIADLKVRLQTPRDSLRTFCHGLPALRTPLLPYSFNML